jgi:hypothetical protein
METDAVSSLIPHACKKVKPGGKFQDLKLTDNMRPEMIVDKEAAMILYRM